MKWRKLIAPRAFFAPACAEPRFLTTHCKMRPVFAPGRRLRSADLCARKSRFSVIGKSRKSQISGGTLRFPIRFSESDQILGESDQILENLSKFLENLVRFWWIWPDSLEKLFQSFSFSHARIGRAKKLIKSWKANFWSKVHPTFKKLVNGPTFNRKLVFTFYQKVGPNFLVKIARPLAHVNRYAKKKSTMDFCHEIRQCAVENRGFHRNSQSTKFHAPENRRKWSLTPYNFRLIFAREILAAEIAEPRTRARKKKNRSIFARPWKYPFTRGFCVIFTNFVKILGYKTKF